MYTVVLCSSHLSIQYEYYSANQGNTYCSKGNTYPMMFASTNVCTYAVDIPQIL